MLLKSNNEFSRKIGQTRKFCHIFSKTTGNSLVIFESITVRATFYYSFFLKISFLSFPLNTGGLLMVLSWQYLKYLVPDWTHSSFFELRTRKTIPVSSGGKTCRITERPASIHSPNVSPQTRVPVCVRRSSILRSFLASRRLLIFFSESRPWRIVIQCMPARACFILAVSYTLRRKSFLTDFAYSFNFDICRSQFRSELSGTSHATSLLLFDVLFWLPDFSQLYHLYKFLCICRKVNIQDEIF